VPNDTADVTLCPGEGGTGGETLEAVKTWRPTWRRRPRRRPHDDEVPLSGSSPSRRFTYEVRVRALDDTTLSERARIRAKHLARLLYWGVVDGADPATLVSEASLDSYLRLTDVATGRTIDVPLGSYAPAIVAETRLVRLNLLTRSPEEIVEIYFTADDGPEDVLAEVIPLQGVLIDPLTGPLHGPAQRWGRPIP